MTPPRILVGAFCIFLGSVSCTRDNYIDGAKIATIETDTVAPRPIPWKSVDIEDERHALVFFNSGYESCNALAPPDIAYGDHEITITLQEGHPPSEGYAACPDVSFAKVVRIQLDEDIAGRNIVDALDETR